MGKHDKTKEVNNNGNNNTSKRVLKRRKRHLFLKLFLLLIVALGILFGIRLYKSGGNFIAAILGAPKRENLDKLQVLILGESTGLSDTIIVSSYDPKTQEASMLSIPRDTFTGNRNSSNISSLNKINSLYNHGKTPEKTLEAVNDITGMDIKYYVLVDTKALIELVNTIGGLDYDVPIDMNYDDYSQDLHIHLTAGWQHLTGEQVEQLVRFRHNSDGTSYSPEYGIEDHGRNKTQRNVIMAIAKQSLQFKNIKEISNIIDIFKEYVDTNMDLDLVKDYVPYAMEMDMTNINVDILPGHDQVISGYWFFLHDEEETQEVVNRLFFNNPSVEDIENSDVTNNNSDT